MADKTASFVVSTITRGDIAACLNSYLELCGSLKLVADDDDRLTDVICEKYAYAIGCIPFDVSEEDRLDAEITASRSALDAMGIESRDWRYEYDDVNQEEC